MNTGLFISLVPHLSASRGLEHDVRDVVGVPGQCRELLPGAALQHMNLLARPADREVPAARRRRRRPHQRAVPGKETAALKR